MDLARRFWPYVVRYRRQMTTGIFLMVLMVMMDLAQPLPLKLLFDYVIGNQPIPGILQPIYRAIGGTVFNLLVLTSGLVISIAAIDGLVSYWGQSRVTNIGQRVVFDMRRDLYAHLQSLPLSFHEKKRTGDLVARLTSDLVLVQNLVVSGIFDLFTNALTLVGMIVIMYWLDWRLTLLALLIMPLMFYVVNYYTTRIRKLSRVQRKKEGQIASISQETMSSQRIVKAHSAEGREVARFEEASAESLDSSIRSTQLQSGFTGAVAICIAFGTGLIIMFGGVGVLTTEFTAGDLIVFLSYLSSMYRPMRNLSKLANTITKATAAAERIVEILDTKSDIRDAPDALELPELKGRIEFDHVYFDYDSAHAVLKDISLRVEPGEKVAIVGSTGAGKTTIVSLLLRFYDPQRGSIRIDGIDLRRVRLALLRQKIAIVLQEAVLFHMTIRENIAYGRPDATLDEVIAAAEAAQAHDFISRLPDAYNTMIGERGLTLSGGERQRIAIARAMLRDSPIVVLDEPTTGLDAEAESLVLRAIDELIRGKTTFIITHKLSMARDADCIYVIEDGSIIEQGTSVELLEKAGKYARLYDIQNPLPGPLPRSSFFDDKGHRSSGAPR